MAEYLSKFLYGEKFERLPDKLELDARGELRLESTKVDMIPAGLKGITFAFFSKKPRYIAPDFDGIVVCYDPRGVHTMLDMDAMEIKAAKARYIADLANVEKPRYLKEEDGSLSLCSLPSDMHIFYKPFDGGYYLDLTRTSIREKQNLGGFKDAILYPKKPVQQEFPFVLAPKIVHHKRCQMKRQKTKVYE